MRRGDPVAGTQVLLESCFRGNARSFNTTFVTSRKSCRDTAHSPQRLGEAELVAVRVGQMEEALAPFGIARRRVRAIAGRDHARMQRVDVGMVEDDASPP